MGLKELLAKLTKSGDRSAADQDYEARKDDMLIKESYAGSEAMETARDDLDS